MAKNVVVAYFAVRRKWRRENEEPQPRWPGLRPRDEKRQHHNTSKAHYCRVNLFGRVNELETPHDTSRNPHRNCVTIYGPHCSLQSKVSCGKPHAQALGSNMNPVISVILRYSNLQTRLQFIRVLPVKWKHTGEAMAVCQYANLSLK
jgi:hypothetical protein